MSIDVLRRENSQVEEEQRRKNGESLELLLLQNEAQLATLMAKQKKEEEERLGRKRKAEQPETNKKQPAAPECPVCLLNFVVVAIFQLLSQVCLDEMGPPTKIFHCVNGHLICETCK